MDSIVLRGMDTDGDKLTYSIVTDPSHGKLISFDSSTGKLTYRPAANYAGEDDFTFKVMDERKMDSNIGKVSIKISSFGLKPSYEVLGKSPFFGLNSVISENKISTTPKTINHNPLVNAGADHVTSEGTNDVTLKGKGKDPDRDSLTYSWEQTGGPRVDLNRANTASSTFSTSKCRWRQGIDLCIDSV